MAQAATVNSLQPDGAPVPTLVTKLTRGFPAQIGILVANNTGVAFTVPEPTRDNQGICVIQTAGTAGTTPTMDVSIDGGETWFVLAATVTPAVAGQLTNDAAASFAGVYSVAGFGSGAVFKFGFAGGSPNCEVHALVG